MSLLDNNYINSNTKETEIEKIDDEIEKVDNNVENILLQDKLYIFGNLNGLVSDKYVKYFNLIILQILSIITYTLIYRFLMIDFDANYFIPKEFDQEDFINNKFLIALFMSINFQTTTAFVDLKCKGIISKSIIILQLLTTILITFLFFT